MDNYLKAALQKYDFIPHPEGGLYAILFQSPDFVQMQGTAAKRYHGQLRPASTAILYYLEGHDYSAWHQIQSDETWCFHRGHPLLLRVIDKQGQLQEILLGHENGVFQHTVRAQQIVCAQSLGEFSLLSCIVSPGFEFKDFQLITRHEFLKNYPDMKHLIPFIRE